MQIWVKLIGIFKGSLCAKNLRLSIPVPFNLKSVTSNNEFGKVSFGNRAGYLIWEASKFQGDS